MDSYDVAVIGGGPAGLSAAVNVRVRGKTVIVVTGKAAENPLYKAPKIENYLGFPDIGGAEFLERCTRHAEELGAAMLEGKVITAAPYGERFLLNVSNEILEAGAVVLACGISIQKKYPGEAEYLGRGVSYCATCDGMLYRGKRVCVVGLSEDAFEEANHLAEIGCLVHFTGRERPSGLREEIPFHKIGKISIEGEKSLTGIRVGEEVVPCDGVFILRKTIAPSDFLPGISLEDGYIRVDRQMQTNIDGIFACGDCTGLPLQIAKAVGEGMLAGQNAANYLKAST